VGERRAARLVQTARLRVENADRADRIAFTAACHRMNGHSRVEANAIDWHDQGIGGKSRIAAQIVDDQRFLTADGQFAHTDIAADFAAFSSACSLYPHAIGIYERQ
jgi:hypothetical protein